MKRLDFINLLIILVAMVFSCSASAQSLDFRTRLSGLILLQVEGKGEAWYVNPADQKRYYLGRPNDAFNVMKSLGIGIKHSTITTTKIFSELNRGKIYIDTEDAGKAYYVYPKDGKAYYLGRPDDAFRVMKELGLGISNANIIRIPVGTVAASCPTCTAANDAGMSLRMAASYIASGNKAEAVRYFTPALKKSIEYTIDVMSSESKNLFAQILANAELSSFASSDTIIFKKLVDFPMNDQTKNIYITLKKQPDGKWLIANL
jgi:hypothetical protein